MLEQAPEVVNSNLKIDRERFIINGAQVDSIDVKPENQENDVPVLFAPGYGATGEVMLPGMKELAKMGIGSVSLSHPRKESIITKSYNEEIEAWYKAKGLDYPEWPNVELQKAYTLLGLLDQKNLDKVDVIAYSEAAINVCIAAMLQPEKFTGRTIILCSPAGLIGKDTLFSLAKRVVAHPKHLESMSHIPVAETGTENRKLSLNEAKKYNKANRFRSFKEGLAISKTRIEDMLRYLHEKGVRIFIIQGVDDTFFPIEEMKKIVKLTGTEGGFVDGFLTGIGGHVQMQFHPELYMSAVKSMLTKPEEK